MALEDVLAAATVRPVIVGWLDFKDAPLRGWTGVGAFAPTGTGDPDLDGEVFLAVEGAVALSDVQQDLGIGGPVTITFLAGEMEDEAVVQQLVADRRHFQTRRAKLWRFFLSDDESSVLPEFDVIFNGVMVSAETSRQPGQGAVITVTCDHDLQKAQAAPVRWIDHQVFYPTDTASTFINSLSRGSAATGIPSMPVPGFYPVPRPGRPLPGMPGGMYGR